ncbi:MAG TPA: proline--tRNA ligase [Magnetospirillum sp.]|nr:proline--tRNA ligase [Magnetospirillum sp.]
MRLSTYFLPTLKETPAEAQIASHRLMLRAGMVRQSASGIYTWLPLGLRVLKKIERIVREEQDAAGAQELLMPTIQSADLWRESGRYDAYGKEMLRITDRHDREMLYGPTNEELITQIFRDNVKSYREMPKILYQIQWKFRDEVRPRFGVMRGREFLMKDCYSFAMDYEGAKRAYEAMFNAYLKTFKRMGLTAVPMQADSGAIGGSLSHEFHILAETGESGVFYDVAYDELAAKDAIDLDALSKLYAVTDEKHDPAAPNVPPPERLKEARGIEVGHIFYLGTKYSKAMNAVVPGPGGEPVLAEMGCYGIGVSRLMGAIIEASHDDRGIKWPESVAPFKVGLINLKAGDATCDKVCEDLYRTLSEQGVEVLYDDRDDRAGVKFADMDLIGLPWQLVAGPKGLAAGVVELKNRHSGEKQELSVEAALAKLTA